MTSIIRGWFQASDAVYVKSLLFWDVRWCRLADNYRRFGQPISHLQGPGRSLGLLDLWRWDRQVVPKRRSLTAHLSCVASQKSKELGEHVAFSKPTLSIKYGGHARFRTLPKSDYNMSTTREKKIHLRPSVMQGLQGTDCHEPHKCSMQTCGDLLYQTFSQIYQEIWKIWADVYLRCDVNHKSHYADFHESPASSTTVCKNPLHRISWKSDKSFRRCTRSQTDTVGRSGGRRLHQVPFFIFCKRLQKHSYATQQKQRQYKTIRAVIGRKQAVGTTARY